MQIREDDKEEVDLKDEKNFSWRRMRVMAFQKYGIPGTMAWWHENYIITLTPKSCLHVLPTLCPKHRGLEKKKPSPASSSVC